jgi:alpha-galactosidase
MLADIRTALTNITTELPDYKDRTPELAGFVWYHGWNDGVDPKTAVPEYEQNLTHLIKDVRRDLRAPNLPVVIGEITGPWVDAPPEWEQLRKAQAATAALPEFKGSVAFAPTRSFVRKPEDSPNPGHGHHEFGNAETIFLVGDALGKAMLPLLPNSSP